MTCIFLIVVFLLRPALAWETEEPEPPEAEIVYSDDEIIIVYDPQTDTTTTYPVDYD